MASCCFVAQFLVSGNKKKTINGGKKKKVGWVMKPAGETGPELASTKSLFPSHWTYFPYFGSAAQQSTLISVIYQAFKQDRFFLLQFCM